MKKIFTTILGIVLATCFVVSCEKDNSNNDTPNPPATAVSGPFTGANGRTIFFAKGNLYKDNGTYKIFPNQYDFVNTKEPASTSSSGMKTTASTTPSPSTDPTGCFLPSTTGKTSSSATHAPAPRSTALQVASSPKPKSAKQKV